MSVSLAITRRNVTAVPPFRAAIMLSGEKVSALPEPNFATFNAFATAMGCSESPGPQRLECLRNISASTIRNYTNGNPTSSFVPQVDKYVFTLSGPEYILMYCHMFGSVTYIDDSLQAIRTGQIPQVPVLLGSMQDDGTIFAPSFPNISVFLGYEFGRLSFYCPPNMTAVMALYPGLNDTQLLDAVVRDVLFRWYVLRLF